MSPRSSNILKSGLPAKRNKRPRSRNNLVTEWPYRPWIKEACFRCHCCSPPVEASPSFPGPPEHATSTDPSTPWWTTPTRTPWVGSPPRLLPKLLPDQGLSITCHHGSLINFLVQTVWCSHLHIETCYNYPLYLWFIVIASQKVLLRVSGCTIQHRWVFSKRLSIHVQKSRPEFWINFRVTLGAPQPVCKICWAFGRPTPLFIYF